MCSAGVSAAEETRKWGPWEIPKDVQPKQSSENSILQSAIRAFQHYISPIDGQRCAMYPTCSSYALQALEKHGTVMGSFIFVDRLYHEGDPIEQERPINKFGYQRYYDPLENNDFWLVNSRD